MPLVRAVDPIPREVLHQNGRHAAPPGHGETEGRDVADHEIAAKGVDAGGEGVKRPFGGNGTRACSAWRVAERFSVKASCWTMPRSTSTASIPMAWSNESSKNQRGTVVNAVTRLVGRRRASSAITADARAAWPNPWGEMK